MDVLGVVRRPELPLAHVDNAAIARLAAEHFLERGFRHFGFCGLDGINWSDERRDAFCRAVAGAGGECLVYTLRAGRGTWEDEQDHLAAWVRSLPRPCAVMACNDPRGQKVLEACRRSGVRVPDEVAVVGVDNDEPICAIADPPLSSVVPDHERVGYEAAALLDRVRAGEVGAGVAVYVPPVGARDAAIQRRPGAGRSRGRRGDRLHPRARLPGARRRRGLPQAGPLPEHPPAPLPPPARPHHPRRDRPRPAQAGAGAARRDRHADRDDRPCVAGSATRSTWGRSSARGSARRPRAIAAAGRDGTREEPAGHVKNTCRTMHNSDGLLAWFAAYFSGLSAGTITSETWIGSRSRTSNDTTVRGPFANKPAL